jgi:flagellar hook-basal body complex protein FliE
VNPVASAGMVSGYQPVSPANETAAAKSKLNQGLGTDNLFRTFLEQTNQDQINSDLAIEQFVAGKSDNVQQVVLTVAKAEMSFQLFMEIRNKLIESYNELMRMQF